MRSGNRFHRIALTFAVSVALVTAFSVVAGAQGPPSVGSTSLPPGGFGASGGAAGTVVTLVFLAAVVIAIVTVARYMTIRRKRREEALLLQAHVSDVLCRASQLQGLVITPSARVPVRRGRPVTLEVTGAVPTPELRETVLTLVRAEVARERSDVITEDHLFIAPPIRRAS